MKNILKRKFKIKYIILIISFGLLIISGLWQAIMQKYETDKYEPIGEMITVNSHKTHLYSLGSGNVTIVFIAGSGTPSAYTDFYYLQNELQQYAKTVSFDYSGFGWSEKTEMPRTIDNLTKELHELLNKSNQLPPYVLVAHSLASLEAIRYAQQYPDEVKGIILLDGGSPNSYLNYSEKSALLLNRTNAVLRVTGINRILGNVGIKLPFVGENVRYNSLPNEIKEIDAAMYYNFIGNNNNLDMINHINENAKTVIENGYLQDIPLLILSSDEEKKWDKVQHELLNWSNKSRKKTIENGKHYLHWSHKEIVISEIKDFIGAN